MAGAGIRIGRTVAVPLIARESNQFYGVVIR
jgi:hypothetical protein